MKLTELTKDLTEVMKICRENKVNPDIWVQTHNQLYEQIGKIKLEIGLDKNNKETAFLIFIIDGIEEN